VEQRIEKDDDARIAQTRIDASLRPAQPMRQADQREAGIRSAAAGCSGAFDAQRSINVTTRIRIQISRPRETAQNASHREVMLKSIRLLADLTSCCQGQANRRGHVTAHGPGTRDALETCGFSSPVGMTCPRSRG
jgi:hypothetical protein